MATARAQGGLRGEMQRFFIYFFSFSVRRGPGSPSFFPTCLMVHPSTTSVTRARQRSKVKIWPLGIVSHTVWSSAEMNPDWVVYSRTAGLVSVWPCFPPTSCPLR